MGIDVCEVSCARDLRQFIRLPFELYAGDANHVPHLLSERKRFFSDRNPIFRFMDVRYLLARDERGEVVGRVTAHINRRHNDYTGENAGFFGFLECVERVEVAAALLNAAEAHLAGEGMDAIRGPCNFSTNEECGMLVDRFDLPPVIMMPYNKPYYPAYMEKLGYAKARDLLAYHYDTPEEVPPYLDRFCRRVQKRANVVIRPLDIDDFQEDVRRAFSVYNQAWARNWGFVPMSEEQFSHMAGELRPVVWPDLALVAEVDGEAVGFSLALPDLNPVFKKMKGRLFPFGLFTFLMGRRSIRSLRIITLGVVPEHRRKGIEMLLIYQTIVNGQRRGIKHGELSWVLEDNVLLRQTVERLGAEHYKTYRIYEKSL
jgi:GNAT superfamily N-acetyltransferase